MGAWAVGMLVSAFVMLKLPLPRPLRMAMAGCSLFALPVATLGFAPYWPVVTIAAFIAGIGTEMFGTAWAVAMMENVPTTVYSRVSSYDMLGSFIAMPIGIWLYGWLATVAPIRDILLVSAVVYAVIALSTFAVPEVWRMGRTANGQAQ